MVDIIIVGAGTAGLTAAIYAARAGLSVLVLEKSIHGGQVIQTSIIENYPGIPALRGSDFADTLLQQAKALGVSVHYERILSANLQADKKQIDTSKATYHAKAVIIATGTSPKKLSIPKEDTFIGRGVAFCAVCDGAFYKNKDVAVIGGGNVALGDTLFLSGLAKTVTLIHRSSVFKAEQLQINQAKSRENIRIITDTIVTEMIGDTSLKEIVLQNQISGAISHLPVNGVFVAIGSKPDNSVFSHQLQSDEYGFIQANEDCHTNLPGVFVAGDTRTKQVRQLVTATADGAVSALAAKEYLDRFNAIVSTAT